MINSSSTTKTEVKQKRNLVILIALIMVGLSLFLYFVSDHSNSTARAKVEKPHFVNPLDHIDAESIVLEKTQKALRDTQDKTAHLTDTVAVLSNEKKMEADLRHQSDQALMTRVTALEKQLTLLQPPAVESENKTNHPSDNLDYRGIREDTLSLSPLESVEDNTPVKNPDTYVPAGSFVRAVMLSGADASAAVNSPSNPEPMVFRLTSKGVMPNRQKSHLKDCFVTAAVIGDISSERGKIRLERLSCTFPNGQTVEQEVEGAVIGPEGKNGVRGTPLWRDGAITQRVFTAGFLSGVANGVSSSYSTHSVSPEGAVQTLNGGKIVQNGLASGGAKSMDKLAEYYIQRAEQYHPVIQLSAGTMVDILFLKGFFLDGKKHAENDAHPFKKPPFDDNPEATLSHETPAPALFPPAPLALSTNEPATLPLSPDTVRRIQEKSHTLGLRVTPASPNLS